MVGNISLRGPDDVERGKDHRINMQKREVTQPLRFRQPQPPPRPDGGRAIKSLILHGLAAFEESFHCKYPEASREEILDHMTHYLNQRTRFEYEHPRRSFRFGRHQGDGSFHSVNK